MDRDRLLAPEALGEVVALEHAGHRVASRELDHSVGAERQQPLGVEGDFRLLPVEDQERLVGVGSGIRLELSREAAGA
jgi:hypothetical protein